MKVKAEQPQWSVGASKEILGIPLVEDNSRRRLARSEEPEVKLLLRGIPCRICPVNTPAYRQYAAIGLADVEGHIWQRGPVNQEFYD